MVLLSLCRDNIFFCRDRVSHSCILLLSREIFTMSQRSLLDYTTESELYVAIDLENVATYFLPLSLSLAELFVTTLKSLSQ